MSMHLIGYLIISGFTHNTPAFTVRACVRVQVSECNWQLRRAPNLRSLYSVCKNMHLWLKQDQRNICIVHCLVS